MSASLTFKTNHVPRDVIDGYELSADERTQFDYIDWDAVDASSASPEFFRFKGELFDLCEFEVWDNPASPTRMGWDGVRPDSYFSGLVVRYVDDFERVIVGTYTS